MFKKKAKYLILFVVILSFVIGLAITAFGTNKWYGIGSEIKNIKNSTNQNTTDGQDIVAKIDQTSITKSELEMAIAMNNFTYETQQQKYKDIIESSNYKDIQKPFKKTPNQVLDDMITDKVLYQEAIKQNCAFSYDEAKAVMEKQREAISDAISGKVKYNNIEQIKNNYYELQDYIKGMGLTEDEYWIQSITAYQVSMSTVNLKKRVISSMSNEDKKDINKVNAYFEQYKKDIKEKYTIEIFYNS